MTGWFMRGLATGVKTTRYPHGRERTPGTRVGFPAETELGSAREASETAARCPTGALVSAGSRVMVERRRCIHCYRCVRGAAAPMRWDVEASLTGEPEWGTGTPFRSGLRRSVNILVVDAGDCGACLNEVRQLNAPQYNMHRLGFFITPTPRNADLLLVVGQVTDAMREPLLSAYRAMAEPRRVAAVGTCALSGAPVGPSFAAGSGVHGVLPVDIDVPGSPPEPLAILRALLLLSGRGRAVESQEIGR